METINTNLVAFDLIDYFGGELPVKDYMDKCRPFFLAKKIPDTNGLWLKIYQEADQLLSQP